MELRKYEQDCAKENLRFLSHIQSIGYYVAYCRATGRIKAYSENLSQLFPVDKANCSLFDIFESDQINKAAINLIEGGEQRFQFSLSTRKTEESEPVVYDALMHKIGENNAIEFKEIETPGLIADNKLRRSLRNTAEAFEEHSSIELLCEHMASQVSKITGFHRVMVYKFDKDFNGEVIAEKNTYFKTNYKGLHFPESDIPAQARKLYETNFVRIIQDVHSTDNKIVQTKTGNYTEEGPQDLTLSLLRSVSKLHIEYLHNMGVRSSMSISLNSGGKLWGLISCHHANPISFTFENLLDLEVMGQLYASKIQSKEKAMMDAWQQKKFSIITGVIDSVAESYTPAERIIDAKTDIMNAFEACGFIIINSEWQSKAGICPSDDEIKAILIELEDLKEGDYVYRNQLPGKKLYQNQIAGYLAGSVSKKHNFYCLWFRQEIVKSVAWGGRKTTHDVINGKLHPRKSFEKWKEKVSGECKEWTQGELDLARKFDSLLVRYVYEKSLFEIELKKLQESEERRKVFMGQISHELRNPLNGILGWTDIALQDPETNPALVRPLKAIQQSSITLQELFESMTLYTKRKHASDSENRICNLSNILEELLEQFKPSFESKGITLTADLQNTTCFVNADKITTKQIISNLLSNAIKYTHKGGTVELSFKTLKTKEVAIVAVKDNGIGISKENLGNIFEKYFQEKNESAVDGLGIGLYLASQFAEESGGRLSATSPGKNKGSIFTLRLPRIPIGSQNLLETADIEACDIELIDSNISSLRILVVEDSKMLRDMLMRSFEKYTCHAYFTENGYEALELIKSSHPFDIILTDISMPVMDGMTLIKEAKKEPACQDTHFVASTGMSKGEGKIELKKVGFDQIYIKPFRPQMIATMINRYLVGSQTIGKHGGKPKSKHSKSTN